MTRMRMLKTARSAAPIAGKRQAVLVIRMVLSDRLWPMVRGDEVQSRRARTRHDTTLHLQVSLAN